MLPKRECPVAIFSADTIGMVKSRQLLQVLLDSGSMVSMIERSPLLPKVITKTFSETKINATLAGKIHMQEVVTHRDLRLLEFDTTRTTEGSSI